MITIIARLKVQDGKEEEALAALREMCDAVQKNEPGALAYAAHRLQDDQSQVVFVEHYKDGDAFKAHGDTPHMQAFRGKFAQLFDVQQVKIERLEPVAGFFGR